MPTIDRPPYRVPSMREIEALPWNGRTVVSTFSGCGGSCLGYRMAGYRVAWASEFVPAAQEVYRANHPGSILSTDDIRTVSPESILEAIGLEAGEVDVLDGSPPCASFSTAGKREKHWGKEKRYSETTQRSDDLFFEYARILRGLRPKAFVAENVSGLVKGKAKGYFKLILAELVEAGYVVEARLLDAKWLGVPQSRERLIFVGVRNDLAERYGVRPAFPSPKPYFYSIRDAIGDLLGESARIVGGNGQSHNGKGAEYPLDLPIGTVLAGGSNRGMTDQFWIENPAGSAPIYTDPETGDAISLGRAVGREWDKLSEGEQSERYFQLVRPFRDLPVGTVTASGGNVGLASVTHPTERRKFSIEGVLVPLTASMNETLLREAGFRSVDSFWRWCNFAGWIAFRE